MQYIKLAKQIEDLEYDRIYVYDNLFYYALIPILTFMAEHTKRIELGSCLLNGFYRHPAIIASNILSINEIAKGRTVLGLGCGAFFDFLEMDSSKENTRKAFEENIKLVKHFLSEKKEEFKGDYFNANKNAYLRMTSADIPLITETWNEKMDKIEGQYCNEIQIAEVWNINYLNRLQNNFLIGNSENNQVDNSKFLIGGICCIAEDKEKCRNKTAETLVVYLPYLTNILKRCDVIYNEEEITKISELSKAGKIKEASQFVTDEMLDTLTIWGTPEKVVEKNNNTIKNVKINSIIFSVPFGIYDSIEKHLKLIKEKVIPYIH